ncbi:hypothetical protein [Microbacterium esteraromaticum]|uniref:hypothetical protein n=1 Tax=Microbacterium esteraromaticum TaxID=57043 RepID=UPI0019D3CEEF|nr:hypothetical protein [Microbacterium esteraromaticum]MBN7793640.1 hypothetical protein [Microbacterium esteraromaticum]
MTPLPKPLLVLVTWSAILPLALLVAALVGPLTTGWPDLLRTGLVITLVVPIAVTWAVPTLARAVQRMRGVPAHVVTQACSMKTAEAQHPTGGAGQRSVAGRDHV